MSDKQQVSKKAFSADWLMRGALTRIGDTFDRLTGRKWIPSSSLATSGLIERLKRLMDTEAREVPGKGTVVPHSIKLKMQWDKFSTDADDAMVRLETELLTAAADHINDSLYYTYAPLSIEVKRDYFTEGVKLFVGFDTFAEDDEEAELNVTVHGLKVGEEIRLEESSAPTLGETFVARFEINGSAKEKQLVLPVGGRISVGRSGVSGLALDDASVSKIHASLAINAAGVLCVADTGSTNGTFINNERISYGKAMEIFDGDRVKFGLVEVEFDHVPEAAVSADIKAGENAADKHAVEGDSLRSDAGTLEGPANESASPASLQNDTIEVVQPETVEVKNEQHTAAIAAKTGDGIEKSGEANE